MSWRALLLGAILAVLFVVVHITMPAIDLRAIRWLYAGRLEYLHLLKLAAELGESAINSLVGEWSGPMQPCKWTVLQMRRFLGLGDRRDVPELILEPELASYDALLSEEVAHVG